MRKIIIFITVLSAPIVSANTGDTLPQKQQQLSHIKQQQNAKQSNKTMLQNKVSILRQTLQQNAKIIQQQEAAILQITQDMTTIKTQQKSLQKILQLANKDLGTLITIAQKIEKHKNIALFLSPDIPKRSMIAIRLIQHIMPQIQQKRQGILATYTQLNTLQAQLTQKQADLQQKHDRIQHSRADLREKITTYDALITRDTHIIAHLQRQQHTLQQQVAQLEKSLQQAKQQQNYNNNRYIRPQNIRPFPMENSPITTPVVGTITTKFNRPMKNGNISDGVYIKTLPNAQVVAPFDGYVAFVGAFSNLGKIVLLAHERGYNSVLIGFEDVFVQNNDWVLEKDPIGTTNTDNKDFKIEIRYGTKTENPLLWIRDSTN